MTRPSEAPPPNLDAHDLQLRVIIYLTQGSKGRSLAFMRKMIGGAIAMLINLIFLAFNYWNALETALAKLRSKGPVGVFIADFITSATIQVVLLLAAVSLFVWAIIEQRATRRTQTAPPLVSSGGRRPESVTPESKGEKESEQLPDERRAPEVKPHDLTFEIDAEQTQVHISGGTGGRSIEADVKLRCHKTVERALAVREIRASLHKEQPNGEETIVPGEGAKVVYEYPNMKRVETTDPWTINEPISGYRYYKFRLDISHEVMGRLSHEYFLRVALYEGARPDPFTADFCVNDWLSARQSNSSITLK